MKKIALTSLFCLIIIPVHSQWNLVINNIYVYYRIDTLERDMEGPTGPYLYLEMTFYNNSDSDYCFKVKDGLPYFTFNYNQNEYTLFDYLLLNFRDTICIMKNDSKELNFDISIFDNTDLLHDPPFDYSILLINTLPTLKFHFTLEGKTYSSERIINVSVEE